MQLQICGAGDNMGRIMQFGDVLGDVEISLPQGTGKKEALLMPLVHLVHIDNSLIFHSLL